MRTGQQVRIEDTTGEERWAGFSMRAAAHGIRSALSLPLTADGQHIGALNRYAPLPAAFGPAETRRAESLAANATGALTLAVRQAASTALTSQHVTHSPHGPSSTRPSGHPGTMHPGSGIRDLAVRLAEPQPQTPRRRHRDRRQHHRPPAPATPLRRNLTGNRITVACVRPRPSASQSSVI